MNLQIPRSVIFVCGPHHNQFLDPLLLMCEVRLSAGRRVSFLIAEKSYHRKFIGLASRIAHSSKLAALVGKYLLLTAFSPPVPVARAGDYAKAGAGKIYLSASADGEDDILKGYKTKFTKELSAKGQIQLGKAYGNPTAEVVEVIDDETVKVKKMFKDKAERDLRAEGQKVQDGGQGGLAYKTMPYIDQTKVGILRSSKTEVADDCSQQMYSSVYKKLSEGGCIGIFPEGGSHDRTDFLPLKHGVAIMALGAMAANPNLQVQIVPVGVSLLPSDH